MNIFYALGVLLFGTLAVAYIIYPFVESMMPTITLLGYSYEVAFWGLLPIIILVMLIPIAISIILRDRKK